MRLVTWCDVWPIPISSRCVTAERLKSCLIRFDKGLANVLNNKAANFVTLCVYVDKMRKTSKEKNVESAF
jgi:hypothetical protein